FFLQAEPRKFIGESRSERFLGGLFKCPQRIAAAVPGGCAPTYLNRTEDIKMVDNRWTLDDLIGYQRIQRHRIALLVLHIQLTNIRNIHPECCVGLRNHAEAPPVAREIVDVTAPDERRNGTINIR